MKSDATKKTQARYDRIAPIYDLMETIVERLAFQHWRESLWTNIEGERILEVGVGTGKNFPYHPKGAKVTGVDISERMLARAKERCPSSSADVDLTLMDAQQLGFADDNFDSAVATFVFCSVPDPVLGLKEINRVVKPSGRVLLLEHVRVNAPIVGPLMDLFDPVMVRLIGPHINRHTVANVRQAGLTIQRVEELVAGGLVKLIFAKPNTNPQTHK